MHKIKKMKKYKKPIIGISIDTGSNKTYSKFPWYAVRINYINSIISANGVPLMLPSKPELANHYFNIIDGNIILLTLISDICPNSKLLLEKFGLTYKKLFKYLETNTRPQKKKK